MLEAPLHNKVRRGNWHALPAGWKKLNGEYYSPTAWRTRFSLRTVRLPVASIECDVNTPDSLQDAWRSLRVALKISWRQL
jgi:hypothetical protein